MEAKLVVVAGDVPPRQYELRLPSVVGRSRSADVTLDHTLVSRQHCEVFEANGMLMVRDLGSRNGTFVGDTRVTQHAVPVKPGDLVTVGVVTLRAEYRASHEKSKAPTWNANGPTVDSPLPDVIENARETHTKRKLPKEKK